MDFKRITLLCGHYGSGKTNIAVNLAFLLKKQHERVAIADLDIVNPYFRSSDSKAALEKAGISLICSEFANTNIDAPALPQQMYAVTADQSLTAVLDIGGDERGALSLGRLSGEILAENNYENLFVINRYRPLTRDTGSLLEVMREIETASRIPFTAIANNSNLGEETTAQTVLDSLEYTAQVSALTGLPVKFTAVKEDLYKELVGKIPDLFAITLQKKVI